MAQLCIRWLNSWWNAINDVPKQGADDLLNLCKGTISKSVQHLREHYVMNRQQCDLLVTRFSEVQGPLAQIQQSLLLDEKTISVLQELHQALLGAERLIHSSCITTSEWLRAAIEQGDMKETLSRILYDVQWHTSVLQSILAGITFEPALCNGKLTVGDEFVLRTAIKEDERVLKERLRSVLQKLEDPTEREIANQLLQQMIAVEDQPLVNREPKENIC